MFRRTLLAVASLLILTAGQPTTGAAASVEEIQASAAEAIRPQLPIQVDAISTWVGVSSEGETLAYSYVVKLRKSELDVNQFRQAMRGSLRNSACRQKDMMSIMELGGRYKYSYTGDDGAFISSITISSDDC